MSQSFDVEKPSVAASYLQVLVEIAAERGLSARELLDGLPFSPRLLEESGGRMSPLQWGLVVNRAMLLFQNEGLGYECGLRMRPTINGSLGYAVLSCKTMREALDVLVRFIASRQRAFSLSVVMRDDFALVELRQNHQIPVLRSFFYEHILVGIAQGMAAILGEGARAEIFRDSEIWFDWSEPAYHQKYKDRLPKIQFSQPQNLLRFPIHFLDAAPPLADPLARQQAVEQCERELAQLGGEAASILLRASAELILHPYKGYPDQDAVAARLHMSTRTLSRHLRNDGTSFRRLLEEARYRDACRLLESSPLDIAEVAAHLGYGSPANFTRAFRQWAGLTPSQFRATRYSGSAHAFAPPAPSIPR